MENTEINEKNNSDTWEVEKIHELENDFYSDTFGNFLFENNTMKLWDFTLNPYERIPITRLKSDYSVTCMTDGLAISRYANRQVNLMRFKKGDATICQHQGNEIISDFQNLGEDILKLIVIEHKPIEPITFVDIRTFL